MKIQINNNLVNIKNFSVDSRKIKPGDMFIAYKGVNNDGHNYIKSAIESGASVIVGEKSYKEVKSQFPNTKDIKYIKVKDGRECWADCCAQQYNYPQKKLKIIGITGTDGKTTTTTIIYEILKSLGKNTAVITSVSAKYGKEDFDTGFHVTTPDPDLLFKLMSDMVSNEVEFLVLEVTSHALVQKRVRGIKFEAVGVTNVTPEHLNLHESFEKLVEDKARIFKQTKAIFLNKNASGYCDIKKFVPDKIQQNGFLFEISDDKILIPDQFAKNFPGQYNIQNAQLAVSIINYLGFSKETAISSLKKINPIKGRFQKIPNNRGLNVIVDFAHTPNSMYELLKTVQELKQTKAKVKVITVFGCAAERDEYKRPQMGKIASQFSDTVIITSEDPRNEDPMKIALEIKSGNRAFSFDIELDRGKAIKNAINKAKKGDWVLILGKGHEKSMNIKGIEYPWSDIDYTTAMLQK